MDLPIRDSGAYELFQNQEKMTEQEMKKQAGGRHVEGLVMTFTIGEQGQDIVIDSAFSEC